MSDKPDLASVLIYAINATFDVCGMLDNHGIQAGSLERVAAILRPILAAYEAGLAGRILMLVKMRDDANAELSRLRPVVEAAIEWERFNTGPRWTEHERMLRNAISDYRHKPIAALITPPLDSVATGPSVATFEKERRTHWQDLTYAAMLTVDRLLETSIRRGTGCTEDNFKHRLKELESKFNDGKLCPTGPRPAVGNLAEISLCPRCEGSGRFQSFSNTAERDCAVCNGTGRIGPDGEPFKAAPMTPAQFAATMPVGTKVTGLGYPFVVAEPPSVLLECDEGSGKWREKHLLRDLPPATPLEEKR